MQDRNNRQQLISFKQFLLKENKLLESLESQEERLKKIVSKAMNVFTSSLIEDKNLLVIKGGCYDGTILEIEFRIVDEEINAGLPDHEEFKVLDIKAFEITKVYHVYKYDRESLGNVSLNLDDATDDIILHAVKEASSGILESSTQLQETDTPHDMSDLLNSFEHDVYDQKLTPTPKFMKNVYALFNKKFFDESLPENLEFIVSSKPRANYVGLASAKLSISRKIVIPTNITLNSSRVNTLHRWMEVMLHEMIHVWDYVTFPEHFIDSMRKSYDSHGKTFSDKGKQFEKFGYYVTRKHAASEINGDDKRIQIIIANSLFMVLNGYSVEDGEAIIRINKKDALAYKHIISDMSLIRDSMKNMTGITILKSNNPRISRLNQTKIKNPYSGFSFYILNDKFAQKFGPFENVESIRFNKQIAEDRDEEDFEVMNHIDDEYARKMHDNIIGSKEVKKLKDGEYLISIA